MVIAIGPHHIGITHTVEMYLSSLDDLTDPSKKDKCSVCFDTFVAGTSSDDGTMDDSICHIKTYLENILRGESSKFEGKTSMYLHSERGDGGDNTTHGFIWEQLGSKMPRITTDRAKMLKIKHNKKYASAFASLKHHNLMQEAYYPCE